MAIEADLTDIAHVIQLAVAPVFLLTGVGTIINALNARLTRIIDRRRVLEERMEAPDKARATAVRNELHLLARRLRLVYAAILLAVTSALLVCLLVASAFVGAFVAIDLGRAIAILFVMAMLALIASLGFFLREIFLAVVAGYHPVK